MKKFFALVLVTTSFYFAKSQPSHASSNPSVFETAMLTGIHQLDTASGAGTFISLANTFERIGNAEKSQWQPFYYASLCYVMMAYTVEDKTKMDVLADKAETLLRQAEELQGNNSEITCLFAMITSCRLLVDPVNRFQEKGPEIYRQLSKAKHENPGNPRIYLMQARMQLHTPEAFGGGKNLAKESIETSINKFSVFKPENAIAPNWGVGQARSFLANLNPGL